MSNLDLEQKRTKWEFIILACMYIGYMGFILCRTAVPVASPAMIKDPGLGLTKTMFGQILGWGTAGMVTGKLLSGMIADWLGGRKVFIMALLVTAAGTITFSIGSYFSFFAGLNFCILFAAAAGWPAMANLISSWYPQNKFGRVWGLISTSSRLSALLSTLFLGWLLAYLAWKSIFGVAGAIGIFVATIIFFFLKARPEDVGLTKPISEPVEVEEIKEEAKPHLFDDKSVPQVLLAFAGSLRFWLMCLSLMCTTVLMEFIGFLPLYITESYGVSASKAAASSSVFPAGCLIALIGGGFIYDKVTRKGRIAFLGVLLMVTCCCVVVLWSLPGIIMSTSTRFYCAMVTLFFFGLTVAPAYYLPMSIFSIEFGGKHCGLLIGIIDATGYGASMLYQFTGGKLVDKSGWGSMLLMFVIIGITATLITVWFTFEDYRSYK